jgi:hypothetical protein
LNFSNFGVMWVMDQCTETRGGTPALVGLSEVIITPAAEFWEDYRQLRSSGVRSSRRFCVQVVYKKAGLKGLKLDLCNAESTTDS